MNPDEINPAPPRRGWLERFITNPLRKTSPLRTISPTRTLGNSGERMAARHLRKLGYRIVARNLVLGNAEADLVCLTPDRRTIVIVEVKTRRIADSEPSGASPMRARSPEAAITAHKQAKLRHLARSLSSRRRWAGRRVRIDVVAIDVPAAGHPTLRHHLDAVR